MPAAPPTPRPVNKSPGGNGESGFVGFDEETNNRYEEIKRGSTHITELQQMTMPQLQKLAREENIVRDE